MRKEELLLLGGGSIHDISATIEYLHSEDIFPLIYETQNMRKYIDKTVARHVKCAADFDRSSSVLAFNEYWISVLLQKQEAGFPVNISTRALKASRSKLLLSETLKRDGHPYVPRSIVSDSDVVMPGMIVRPDCGYSGRGVKHLKTNFSADELLKIIHAELPDSMMAILQDKNVRIIQEPYIDGVEYSCDVIIGLRGIKVIRLCMKRIHWLNGFPCVTGYLTKNITQKQEQSINKWCHSLFNENDISFAQFDFIETQENIYPLDFSARIGGGLTNLLSAASPNVTYGKAIAFALGRDVTLPTVEDNWAQYNILPFRQSGILTNLQCNWPKACNFFRKVNCGTPVGLEPLSKASSRIAEVIVREDSEADFLKMNAEQYIDYACAI